MNVYKIFCPFDPKRLKGRCGYNWLNFASGQLGGMRGSKDLLLDKGPIECKSVARVSGGYFAGGKAKGKGKGVR